MRALREPDRRRRDEERLSRSEQRTGYIPKQLLDTKSPIQVRIHLPPAGSQQRTFRREPRRHVEPGKVPTGRSTPIAPLIDCRRLSNGEVTREDYYCVRTATEVSPRWGISLQTPGIDCLGLLYGPRDWDGLRVLLDRRGPEPPVLPLSLPSCGTPYLRCRRAGGDSIIIMSSVAGLRGSGAMSARLIASCAPNDGRTVRT